MRAGGWVPKMTRWPIAQSNNQLTDNQIPADEDRRATRHRAGSDTGMNLRVETAAAAETAKVFELEFWLVHRDPAGKETTLRQVVRTGSLAAEFYFDDLKVETDKGPITVGGPREHQPASFIPGRPSPLQYVGSSSLRNRLPTLDWKTREGDSSYGGARSASEVVAYQLTPLPDDGGAFVGHRLSLRVRVKVLQTDSRT